MATDHAKVKDQHDRYRYARDNGHIRYLEKAKKCENYYAGRQWDEVTKARLQRLRRPALTMNKILPAIAAVQGEQISNRVDVAFRAGAAGEPETAAALDKIYLYVMNDQAFDQVEGYMFDDGIITSRGYVDIRMNFDKNIRGEIDISLDNPLNVMLDPDAEEYEPCTWKELFTTRWLSLNDIKRLYGKEAHAELKGKTKSDSGFGYDFIDNRTASFGNIESYERVSDDEKAHRRRLRLIERQYKDIVWREHFVDVITGDIRPVPEHWDRNRISAALDMFGGTVAIMKRQIDCVYWLSTIDDIVVHDKKSPYRSFTKVPYFPFFRRGESLGLVEGMLDPSEFYNKMISQELHIVNSTANGGWKLKKGSLTNMSVEEVEERGADTGLVLELDDVNDAEKIQPNQVPTGLDRLAYMISEDFKDASMVSDSARGFDRADVAAKAIQQKKASSSSNFAKPLENLLTTRRLVADKVLELVQDFYTEERTYRITTGGLMPQDDEVTVNQISPEGMIINDVTQGEYSIVLTTVPARNEFEDSQFDEAVRLREMGVQIPDHVLIEHSHLNRKQELAEEIKQRTGWGDPSELEQEAAQLENQLKQLEADEKAAKVREIESQTTLNLVRAQEAADESEGEGEDRSRMAEIIAEQENRLLDAKMKRYEIDQNIRLKRDEIQKNYELQREKLEKEMALKERQAEEQAALARKQAEDQAAIQKKQAAAKPKPTEK